MPQVTGPHYHRIFVLNGTTNDFILVYAHDVQSLKADNGRLGLET